MLFEAAFQLEWNDQMDIGGSRIEATADLPRAGFWRRWLATLIDSVAVLVIDKNVENLTRIADRHYIIERGRAVWSGTSQQLIAEPDLQHRYLGV